MCPAGTDGWAAIITVRIYTVRISTSIGLVGVALSFAWGDIGGFSGILAVGLTPSCSASRDSALNSHDSAVDGAECSFTAPLAAVRVFSASP